MELQKKLELAAGLALAAVLAATLTSCAKKNPAPKEHAVLSADFSAPATEVSGNLFGIFYEDINYAADGGLYGEMIQNRSFEYQSSKKSATYSWNAVSVGGRKSSSRIAAAKEDPLNSRNLNYCRLEAKNPGDGISNSGYSGLYLEKGKNYPGSLWIRSKDSSVKSVTVRCGAKDSKEFYETKINGITDAWKKFEFTVTATETTGRGALSLFADTKGSVDFDMVSLFRADIYRNEPNGLRADLAQALEDMHPAFVRFPGGCVIEGKNINARYRWKDTIGPVEQRKEETNFWGYQQSYGLGFYEYFRLCEDIGAEPVPVINCGISFNGEIDAAPVSKMQNYVQDALDLIEYANGSPDSLWGKKRAEAGHPEPFNMKYLGLGNEHAYKYYFDRYKVIAQEINKVHPDIKLIISAGPYPGDKMFHSAWSKVREWKKSEETKNLVSLVDEHYYCEPEWFLGNNLRYDNKEFYPRSENAAKVFIGEYASHVSTKKNNWWAALASAAYMTGIERNGDVIELSSYAPLFAKDHFTQWTPDMIWFNDSSVCKTPDYYVQKIFMTNRSDRTVKHNIVQAINTREQKSIGGSVGFGSWLTQNEYYDIKLVDNDTKETLYESGSELDLRNFITESGSWKSDSGKLMQKANSSNCRTFLRLDENKCPDNYTLTAKAKKNAGYEGFIIIFGATGKNKKFYWWNIGGWGNTQSTIEKGTKDLRTNIGNSKKISIETGKEYSIKVEVRGEKISCYLDGKLVQQAEDKLNFDQIYSHVGKTDDGKIIIKIVNVSDKAQDVQVNLRKCGKINSYARVQTISGNPEDENSFAFPEKICIKEDTIPIAPESFMYNARPCSVNVITLSAEK